jgi:hypothetical protein
MTTTTTYTPPLVFRYSLNGGQSVSTNAIQTTNVTHSNGTPPSTDIVHITQTYTFLGREDLTVQAGLFPMTCKWSSLYTVTEGAYTKGSTQWITLKGVTVKDGGVSVSYTELVSGTFNGGPVGP